MPYRIDSTDYKAILVSQGVSVTLLDEAIKNGVNLAPVVQACYYAISKSAFLKPLSLQYDWQLYILGKKNLNDDSFDKSQKDNWGAAPIHYAAWSGNSETLHKAIELAPSLLRKKDDCGCTIAEYAALSGNSKMLQKALRLLRVDNLDYAKKKLKTENIRCIYKAAQGNIRLTDIVWSESLDVSIKNEIDRTGLRALLASNKATPKEDSALGGLVIMTRASITQPGTKNKFTFVLPMEVVSLIASFLIPGSKAWESFRTNALTFGYLRSNFMLNYLLKSFFPIGSGSFFDSRRPLEKRAAAFIEDNIVDTLVSPENKKTYFDKMQPIWEKRLPDLELTTPRALITSLQKKLKNTVLGGFRYKKELAYLETIDLKTNDTTDWGTAYSIIKGSDVLPEIQDYVRYRALVGAVEIPDVRPGRSS